MQRVALPSSPGMAVRRTACRSTQRPNAVASRHRRIGCGDFYTGRLIDVVRIRLAENFRALFYAPFYATQALGFYAREGVEVELISSSSPGYGVSALLDGTVDITWGGPMRVIKAVEQQSTSPLVCFCEVVARDPFYLIGRNTGPKFDLADLQSLRFAAVSEVPTPWMCLQQDLRDRRVDLSMLNLMADRSMACNFAALCNNQLDVVQV